MTHDRSIAWIAEPVSPAILIKYSVACLISWIKIVIALKIVYDWEAGRCETPDFTRQSCTIDLDLVDTIEALAQERAIPYQRTILARGGQDGAAAQQAAAGARAVGIVVGTRYIHTVTEMIHKTDLGAARDILAAYLETVA